MKRSKKDIGHYDCIVIGAGSFGLFYCASENLKCGASGRKIILEKTPRPGQKLLMSGNGMCNFTHGGSIKDFIAHYGNNGHLIRNCLYKHNNLEFREMMEMIGVPSTERQDSKIFPASMKASDVLDALLSTVEKGGWELKCNASVSGIRTSASSEIIAVPVDREIP